LKLRSALAAAAVSATTLSLGVAVPLGTADATPTVSGQRVQFSVLADAGASTAQVEAAITAAGGTVDDVNEAVGLYQVSAPENGFAAVVSAAPGVQVAARQRAVGREPLTPRSDVEKAGRGPGAPKAKGSGGRHGKPGAGLDPLDGQNWGLTMVKGDKARRYQAGDRRVTVGIIDTGVDASNPDIAPNFDWRLSRNFVTDMPDIDGDTCEFASCKDPVGWDDGAHGTHVAGIIGAAANGIGISGVAPRVTIVEDRAGQDSGYFFLQPTVDALTYAGDAGLDVVNMSFYVDPWLYNCTANPADTPEQQAEQRVIIAAMQRALNYAHRKGVTLVSALGNEHSDLGNPPTDTSSPDYGEDPHPRPIDNASCLSMPTEGPHVIGVSALGSSGRKAYYSNWGTEQISVSAPGGDYYDPAATGAIQQPGNLILSAYPKNVGIAEGTIDPVTGDLLDDSGFYVKDCDAHGRCGYYQYLQGTSMASPFAAGVAALIVSEYGHPERHGGFGLDPDVTAKVLTRSADETPCPAPVFVYPAPIPASYSANCDGTTRFNGFYGHGIVDALAAVTGRY
jgi:lantibiotic leader peptide-processing serine protease